MNAGTGEKEAWKVLIKYFQQLTMWILKPDGPNNCFPTKHSSCNINASNHVGSATHLSLWYEIKEHGGLGDDADTECQHPGREEGGGVPAHPEQAQHAGHEDGDVDGDGDVPVHGHQLRVQLWRVQDTGVTGLVCDRPGLVDYLWRGFQLFHQQVRQLHQIVALRVGSEKIFI